MNNKVRGMNGESASRVLSLADFNISPQTGFITAPPLIELPGEYFAPWEEVVKHLPELNKHKQLREAVDSLPERDFNQFTLKTEEEWRRAYTMLCFLGQSYIWGEGQKGIINTIPRKLAIPWCAVSNYLGMKPVGCYASTTLYNFHLRDPDGPWNVDNFSAINTFTGTEDEDGFYKTFLQIELGAVPTLRAIARVFDDMMYHRITDVQACLVTMQQSLQGMRIEMEEMIKRCKPVTFYVDIRPFQAGSKGIDVFPDGIIYDGVDSKPCQYHGANAGQSSIIYAIDITLGTWHCGDGKKFLNAMKLYMPQKHREFLETLKEMPSIRDFCIESGDDELTASFNDAVKELGKFRTDHVILVTRYIVNQRQHSVNPSLDTKGSGGTDFMKLLKKIRNETLECMIK